MKWFWYILLWKMMLMSTTEAQIIGKDVSCGTGEGKEFKLEYNTPCIKCFCVGGIVECKNYKRECPDVSRCTLKAPKAAGECCERCQGCTLNGTEFNSGDSWVEDSRDPCIMKTCDSGLITEFRTECAAPQCSHPAPPPKGQCCPTCRSCSMGGLVLKEGEKRQDSGDPCRECSCHGGSLSCQIRSCPVLSCPISQQTTAPDSCCPYCARPLSLGQLPGRCLFRNVPYYPGASFNPDTCTACSCTKDLRVTCKRNACKAGYRPQSCVYQGSTHLHGAKWTSGACRECNCDNGTVSCLAMRCPSCPPGTTIVPQLGECCPACRSVPRGREGICTVFGDPHYKTFDGKIFNFQGSCKYLLTKDCSPNNNSTFSIRITNDARDTLAFSWLRTVTVRVGETKISLLQKMRVKVDGKRVSLPYIKLGVLSVMKDGYRVVLRTMEGARVLWDGVSFLELTVPPSMMGNMCGLCGNFNGDHLDDLTGRHGSLLESGQEFGNSWRVGGRRACSVLPRDVPVSQPPCRDDWNSNIQSNKHCAAIKSEMFAGCHSRVAPEYYFRACQIDMCECPGSQCHCEVLTAYARQCERAGLRVAHWRQETGCRHVRPFKYSGEHLTSMEASVSSHANATFNEVIKQGGYGIEVMDEFEEPIDWSRLNQGRKMPRVDDGLGRVEVKNRVSSGVGRAEAAFTKAPFVAKVQGSQGSRSTKKGKKKKKSEEEKRLKELERKKRKRERQRKRKERKRKRKEERQREKKRRKKQSIGKLEFRKVWEMMKPMEEGEDFSGEDDRTSGEQFEEPVEGLSEVAAQPLRDYSEVKIPGTRTRTPLPLIDSRERHSSQNFAQNVGHRRKNWKRRRHAER